MTSPSVNGGLNRRVKLLILLLSRVLKGQLDPPTYEALKTLRLGFIALRDDDDDERRDALMARIEALSPAALNQIIRAYNIYFSLLNIAEEAYNLAERRKAVSEGGRMWEGSFHDTLLSLRESGVHAEDLGR
ncbi:MAG TPA: phosphoenolpyruvate carboxylase, partial [Thiobacillaceae bacterium]|nr:phosphoenolpyruvate carboxylase [Thiobacillaceae bacterium]